MLRRGFFCYENVLIIFLHGYIYRRQIIYNNKLYKRNNDEVYNVGYYAVLISTKKKIAYFKN